MSQDYVCPWCGHAESSEASIQYHIEERHTDDSPFVVRGVESDRSAPGSSKHRAKASQNDTVPRLKCTRPGCGQYVELRDIDVHLKHHDNEGATYPEHASITDSQDCSSAKDKGKATTVKAEPRTKGTSLLGLFNRRSSKITNIEPSVKRARLGREELGHYAFESAMPASVRRVLELAERPVMRTRITSDGKLLKIAVHPNETEGIISILADLVELSDVATTYLCHKSTKHIHRIKCDGNFCGYWNIQMLLSYVLAQIEPDRGLPTVLQIQETIEAAWAEGICAYGKIETGGIANTRKWIGTHEALAFFTKIGLSVSAASFKDAAGSGSTAGAQVLDAVEAYFKTGSSPGGMVTDLPPIYLQRAGHSMTIIGLQRRKNGKRDLIVFDPSRETAPAMTRLLAGGRVQDGPSAMLEPYIRSERRLSAWHEYELLTIDSCEGLKLPGSGA